MADAPGPRVLSTEEQRRLAEQEENTLRELRLFLRDVTKRLATDKRFSIFSKPVDIEEVKRRAGSLASHSQPDKHHFYSFSSLRVAGVRLLGGDPAAHGPVHHHDQD